MSRWLQWVSPETGGAVLGVVVTNVSSLLFPNNTETDGSTADTFQEDWSWLADDNTDSSNSTYNNNNTSNNNATDAGDEEDPEPSDSSILRATFTTYGSALVVILLIFCWARQRYVKVFNLRNYVEDRKTALADNAFGFFSWAWQLYLIDDERIMMECGMDSVCFVRICSMGLKLSLMGMFCGCFLMPVYASAHEMPETKNVTDSVVELTTAHVGPGSPRLVATALAAYVFFGYAIYLILTELEQWFIPMRHKFLMKVQPRNYAVFVRNIPPEYQTNRALEHFFSRCLGVDASHIEAHIGLTTKNLKTAVTNRDATLLKLERALAEKEILGITPTHKEKGGLVPGVAIPGMGQEVNSINFYASQLAEQNQDITKQIERLEDVVGEELDLVAAKSHESGEFDVDDEEEVGFLSFVKSRASNAAGTVTGSAGALAGGATNLVGSAATQAISLLATGEDGDTLPGGFVVFRKLAQAQMALQMLHHGRNFLS